MASDRELRAETVVHAPRARVWEVLTDFSNMVDASPELVAIVPLLPGGLRVGQQYVGLNRRKAVFWPTRNVVAEVVPERRLVWDTKSSGARWIYELEDVPEGTRVVERRTVPGTLTRMSHVFAAAFLGGLDAHADELETHLGATLTHLKGVAEAA